MTNYSLTTLLKIRENKKITAEIILRDANYRLEIEKGKLTTIETCLRNTVEARTKMQHNFFLKAQVYPYNKREIAVHISSREKNLFDECSLKKSAKEQKELVKYAAFELEVAKTTALEAHRNLKIIEKHYALWQQQKKSTESMRIEYDNDEQNNLRFVLKKA